MPLSTTAGAVKNATPLTFKRSVAAIFVGLFAVNLLVWIWAFIAFRDFPLLLGTAFLAYSFGLRHAVDADHIAAIDNVTRKLIQEGQPTATVGLFFSLGHSTIVILATLVIALTASTFKANIEALHGIGGLIGTSVSALFLLLVAVINLVILRSVYLAFRRVRRGERVGELEMNTLLAGGGLIARLVRPLFGLISRSWHLYPLGFLFGLGFDTATEIGLLGISAAQASQNLPIWSILVFPALFTAGMALVDTADSVMMTGAYHWALVKPARKLYYNLTITSVSVLVALLVGGLEAANLLASNLNLEGGVWDVIASLNDNFGLLGYLIVGLFAVTWILSLLFYRFKGYDRLDLNYPAA
ncbi:MULTISPECIES: HoxN/HupN/NixA family nickel/cobalt transporter [unclassified Pseudomonas]|uniref:HoxN/HupN/NixA family nickel/cobalt transporter n=1 Tax=unclassified Pseudomonas TaxID=196821 RepID=UPI002AC8BF35|nr:MULTISPECIES: HoxN/HupN/NixA family nickel/cobalt transporter [unclassified Pseudomonas]MEB0041125.1 HoxN/HupN/NixA family nickel/cobalt transporter [Pseudomonas sp. MH10]MEB0120309.1 HoxN/HupN/NixA family nickel/cobalt transporter [Pseudomonas sp. CCI1.2]WPX65633.1 HoxN/HupN/NixA family nickel/cobalt transporter [Pseudomonas sp. MH10]